VIGPVYPIAEASLLEVILTKLRQAQATGVLGQVQRDAQARMRRGIEQPQALSNVSKTTHARTHYYDPSLVVPYAITDADGRIIIAPGTTVNPLDTVSLSKHLLFFDARDAAQVKLARALLDQHQGKVKLILTGGSYLDLMQRWQLPVFFDQQGQLTTKLRIRQVPALVYQEGKRLRIDELL
jgi:conjugal transfer pilus assembly protein TraW